METNITEKDQKLVDGFIAELEEAGYSYDDMILIFREAQRMYHSYKERQLKLKNKKQ